MTLIINANYCLQCENPASVSSQNHTDVRTEPVGAAGRMTALRLIVHYVGGSVRSHLVPVMIMAPHS